MNHWINPVESKESKLAAMKEHLNEAIEQHLDQYVYKTACKHLDETACKQEPISMMKAFDLYCRHNDAGHYDPNGRYGHILNLRQTGHWFKVVRAENPRRTFEHGQFFPGDFICVASGYLTNVTQGWTFDVITDRRGGGSGDSLWHKWKDNMCTWASDVKVVPTENPQFGL